MLEAAAFGAPTLFDSGGEVGVASRLSPARGEAFDADFSGSQGPATAAAEILSLLRDRRSQLEAVGGAARKRALAWNLRAFGRELVGHVHGFTSIAATMATEAATENCLGDERL